MPRVSSTAPTGRVPSPADDRSPEHLPVGGPRGAIDVLRRAAIAFYDDQMTQHAGALTYYSLMSLFPVLLLGVSVLGLVGEYPRTYTAIVDWASGFTPAAVLDALDSSLRRALQHKGDAATALVVSALVALYGTTGVLESARRALNVVFEIERGRKFLSRKAVDVGSTIVLMTLVLVTVILVFVGRDITEPLLGHGVAEVWSYARWPAALLMATLVFAWLYWVTADRQHRRFRWLTPGSVTGVLLWVSVSAAFGEYATKFVDVSAIYGAFAGPIVLVGWMWLSGVVVLFGAEIDAEVERRRIARAQSA
jgi:membrane protein